MVGLQSRYVCSRIWDPKQRRRLSINRYLHRTVVVLLSDWLVGWFHSEVSIDRLLARILLLVWQQHILDDFLSTSEVHADVVQQKQGISMCLQNTDQGENVEGGLVGRNTADSR